MVIAVSITSDGIVRDTLERRERHASIERASRGHREGNLGTQKYACGWLRGETTVGNAWISPQILSKIFGCVSRDADDE